MPKAIWSVACRSAVVDRETNKCSLLDVIERIVVLDPDGKLRNSSQQESTYLRAEIHLATLWRRAKSDQPEQARARTIITGPSGKRIGAPANMIAINLLKSLRARTFMKFGTFPLNGVGTYWFSVQLEGKNDRWKTVGRVPVDLLFVDSENELLRSAGLTGAIGEAEQ